MADHSVVTWNELFESEASWASVLCFDNASSEKSSFVRELVFFISLRLRVFMFLNATRRDRNCPVFASKGKNWIHWCNSLRQRKWAHDRRGNWSLLATFSGWKTFNRKSSKWQASPVVIQHNFHGLCLSQSKEKLLLKVVYVLQLPLLYPDWIKHEKNFTVVSPSERTSTAPVVEASESIEPNDNNLKLNAIGCIFSKIF